MSKLLGCSDSLLQLAPVVWSKAVAESHQLSWSCTSSFSQGQDPSWGRKGGIDCLGAAGHTQQCPLGSNKLYLQQVSLVSPLPSRLCRGCLCFFVFMEMTRVIAWDRAGLCDSKLLRKGKGIWHHGKEPKRKLILQDIWQCWLGCNQKELGVSCLWGERKRPVNCWKEQARQKGPGAGWLTRASLEHGSWSIAKE